MGLSFRATDAWDKRTNVSILEKYFCEEVMTDGFKFSESGLYYAPAGGLHLCVCVHVTFGNGVGVCRG